MPGLFDLEDPMVALSLGLIGGTSPNFGQNILSAAQFAQAQRESMLKRKMLEMQMESSGLDLQSKRQSSADNQLYRSAMDTAPDVSRATLPSMAPTVANAQALSSVPKPSPYDQAAKMVEYLRSKKVSEQFIKPYVEQMEKLRPKFKADQQLVKMPDGSLGMINIADDGSAQVVPYTPAEKLKEVNRGGTVGMAGEYTGKMGAEYSKTMEPGEIARLMQGDRHFAQSNALGWYNATRPQLVEGQEGFAFVSPPVNGRGPTVTPTGLVGNKNQPSETELTAAGYAGRMARAEQDIQKVGERGLPTIGTMAAAGIAGKKFGPQWGRAAERAVMSNEQRQYRQAQEDWVRAKLRKESGAVIAEDEMQREIETYFPQPGDDAGTRAQKTRSRATAMEAMATASGKARNRVEGTTNARPPLEAFQR